MFLTQIRSHSVLLELIYRCSISAKIILSDSTHDFNVVHCVDEFKHILGSETSRRGLLAVFQLFQHPVLNRRLLYVLLEGTLSTMFAQDHPLDAIFTRLHSRSPRVLKSNLTRTTCR
ncbi:sorting nexin 13 [Homalodisca vitripennis]|nr:sorting nexin 13 [Homalodisca vitripennis]